MLKARAALSRLFAPAPLLVALTVVVPLLAPTPAAAQIVINELDYDQASTDAAEFVELKNVGSTPESLDGYALELVNGSNDSVYSTIALPAVQLATGDYFVVCANPAETPHCDLDVSPDTNLVQNGSPDAVVLSLAGAIVDAVSYEGTVSAPYNEGDGSGLVDDPGLDFFGLSRFPDGADTDSTPADWSGRCITPGEANTSEAVGCSVPGGDVLVINEIDYDQPSTDAAEFVEIKNGGLGPVDLSGYLLRFVNGSTGVPYADISLPAVALAAGDYFVVCGDAANVANCDLDVTPDTNLIQNGAPDAVALVAVADGSIVDTVSYEGDTVAPYTEGSGVGLEDPFGDFLGISRIPDGADTDQNDTDFSARCATPGLPNSEATADCGPAAEPQIVINEIDYDQPGTDAAEFVELKNVGPDAVDLDPFVLELVNGNGGSVYGSFDLPAVMLPPGGYFVVCGDAANTPGCDLDVSPDTNLIQNGAPDAVRLVLGSFVVDAVSYEGSVPGAVEGSGDGLFDSSSADFLGISRFPDGLDTDQNNADFSPRCITPGAENSADSSGCSAPVLSALVINEVDYDQPGTDAAEFVELKNVGSTSVDLSAYQLELVNGNGATAYQSFALPAVQLAPGDYFVLCADAANTPDCDLDVSPDTNLIQNGAPDAVVLVSGGEVVDALSYEGSVPGAVEGTGFAGSDGSTPFLGLSRLPDGFDSDDNSADFSLRCISPGAANLTTDTDCEAPGTQVLEIWEIQGAGFTSPVEGLTVQTLANVVTAVGPEGFFIQTPDGRVDADPETSNGIYVFTGAAPTVAVGDLVDVTGRVVEFFDFTELTSPVTVDVVGVGVLPLPVLFDQTTPSPNQPQPATELERYEGMLVAIVDGTVTGPNQSFGSDPIAEVFVTAASSRTFREKGIEYPGLSGLPVWDGNPEVFELDPDKLGLPNQTIAAGSSFDAVGALGYEFGGYELWPSSLTVREAILPQPVRAEAPGEYTLGSLNLFRLFDDIDDPGSNEQVVSTAEYQVRLEKFSRYIREVLGSPDILGVQEVESEKTLQDLGDRIAGDDPSVQYTAYLVEGNDVGGIDVGFLVRESVTVDAVTQLAAGEINTFDGSLLHDRPPLLLEGSVESLGGVSNPVSVLNLHMRSLGGIDDPADGDRVRSKRLQQAQSVASIVQDLQTMDPSIRLVVVGDFNAFEFTDGYVDVTGQIQGDFDPSENLLSGPDLVDPNLTNQVLSLPAEERYSFIFGGSAQVLDHALTSSAFAGLVRGFEYGRGNADAALILLDDPSTALRSSDHDGLVLYVAGDGDGDGVGDDLDNCPTVPNPDQADADGDGLADACLDACPGTVVPEIAASQLRPNHFALVDGDLVFDQGQPWNGAPVSSDVTLDDTAGCSCSQILDALPGSRTGQRKHGCTQGTMEKWVGMVN